jgi:hypothetical protein
VLAGTLRALAEGGKELRQVAREANGVADILEDEYRRSVHALTQGCSFHATRTLYGFTSSV